MTKSMLIIPGEFVPANNTVTLLNYRRLKHLNINKDVIALDQKPDSYIQKQLEIDQYYKTFNIEYACHYENTVCFKHPLRLPIGLINMQRYIRKSFKKYKSKHYDYIYTSSYPGICHICGYKIKKYDPNVIWYASFSDPVKGSLYKKDPFLKKRNIFYQIMFHGALWAYFNNKYEEVAIEKADKLIFICEEQRDFTIAQYPEYKQSILDRSIILNLHYDDDWERLDTNNEKHTPLFASHAGRIYGHRRIEKFLEALKELKDEDKDLSKKIVFHQYGVIQKEYVKYINDNKLNDVFVLHDTVPYGDILEVMKNSDVLMLFDTIVDKEMQPYLPSKVAEYIATNKPIFSICNENSPAYRILKEMNNIVSTYDTQKIKESIVKILVNDIPVSNTYTSTFELNI